MSPWNRDDTLWLRNLLSQPSGEKLVTELRSRIPKIKALTKEGAWVSAVNKQGHEEMLEKFLDLSELGEPQLREIQSLDLTKEGD